MAGRGVPWSSRGWLRSAPLAAVLVALAAAPLLHLPSPRADAWPELFRRGVVGGLVALASGGALAAGVPLASSPLAWPLGVLVSVHAVSAFGSRLPGLGLVETVRMGGLALIALLASAASARPWQGQRGGAAPLIRVAFLVAVGLAALLGTLENRNDLGSLAAAAFTAAVVSGFATPPGVPRDRLSLALAPVALAALIFSRTRGAWVAVAVVLAWTGIQTLGSRRARAAVLVLAVLLAAGIAASLPGAWPLAASVRGRWELWRGALRLFAEHPLLGQGPGAYRAELPRVLAPGAPLLALDAHSDPLQALAETGLLGFASLVWLGLAALPRPWRGSPSRDHEQLGWAAAGAVLVLHSFTHLVLHATAPAAALFAALGLANPGPGETLYKASPRRGWSGAGVWAASALAALVAAAPAVAAIELVRADRWVRSGRLEAADRAAARALRVYPPLPEAHDLRAEVALVQGDFGGALAEARRGLRLAPGDSGLHLRAAQALWLGGDDEDAAREELDEAERLEPASATVKRWRGLFAGGRPTPAPR